jgi:hypothetical protein
MTIFVQFLGAKFVPFGPEGFLFSTLRKYLKKMPNYHGVFTPYGLSHWHGHNCDKWCRSVELKRTEIILCLTGYCPARLTRSFAPLAGLQIWL